MPHTNNYQILQDNDCHWYWIPNELVEDFKYRKDDEDEMVDDMKYDKYRTGGGPNIIPPFYLSINK